MNFKTQYRLLIHKSYFDRGIGLTNYAKYPIALFALYEFISVESYWITISLVSLYAIACYFLGMWWFRSNFVRAEAEVNNRYNYFQQEVREALKSNKFK